MYVLHSKVTFNMSQECVDDEEQEPQTMRKGSHVYVQNDHDVFTGDETGSLGVDYRTRSWPS